MYADTIDRLLSLFLWKYKTFDNYEYKLLSTILEKGMVALDIGANIGAYSLHMANQVGAEGRVFAFEPDPANCSLFVKNINANGYKNIKVVPKAVSDISGSARLYLCRGNRGDHHIFHSSDDRESIEIASVKLDEYFSDAVPIDVIKMDIQGAEFLAFIGMKNILSKYNTRIITEFCPSLMKQCGQKPEAFLDQIESYGFTINYINEHDETLDTTTPVELMAICDKAKYINLYLEKRNRIY
ncbi:MAG: FkbM family methyltransferase [Desulfobacterales bacterium]|jgi:FkbM family methyltransferase|nr:FkbM family methyltransferase [Desulfobacterales bacterium]MDP6806680.1 FkbM family methyltransferase [Desulfobacterales bacterium]|tara:strand:+ start:26840 stop:27562 length:723 start_codon:yes stop_codon:yes gene_type:complete